MDRTETLRVDLHARSRGHRAAYRLDPSEVQRTLLARGMDLVTIADPDTLDGCLRLAETADPRVFLSATLTVRFAEDGCRVRVGLVNPTEAVFAEAMRRREDLHALVRYLEAERSRKPSNGAGLAYFLCHPLRGVDNRPHGRRGSLRVRHLEQAVLLFDAFEVRSGSSGQREEDLLTRYLDGLDRAAIERLANRHGIEPRGAAPWRKARLGGSGVAGLGRVGRAFTEFDRRASARSQVEDLVVAIHRGVTRPSGRSGGLATAAGVILDEASSGPSKPPIALRIVRHLTSSAPPRRLETVLTSGIAMILRGLSGLGSGSRFDLRLAAAVAAAAADRRGAAERAAAADDDDRLLILSDTVLQHLCAGLARDVRRAKNGAHAVRVGCAIAGGLAVGVCAVSPFLAGAALSAGDRALCAEIEASCGAPPRAGVVLFTDTFFDVNGVAKTVRRMLREAERRGLSFTVVTCVDAAERQVAEGDAELRRFVAAGRLRLLDARASCAMPEYDGLRLRVPSPLEVLRIVESLGVGRVQLSTPGPVGLVGLAVGRALGLRISATYHTNFPEYVEDFSGSRWLEGAAWTWTIRFYQSVDEVVVPSRAMATLLHARGLRDRRVLMLDRWVDTERFCPDRRDPAHYLRLGADPGATVFVYVGRVSVEKNLACLADAFTELCARGRLVHLAVLGDGPYRAEFERRMAGLPATFCGFVGGDELPVAVASADVKVFPSTTDTWGNAPLEAMSSGLPVIVTDQGGPQEFVDDGVHGLLVEGRSVPALVHAMERLLDAELRSRLGASARRHAVAHRVDRPYRSILEPDAYTAEPPGALVPLAASGRPVPRLVVEGATRA
jgi:glycosyltransferase involved in cell wall biosynthesis